MVPRFCVATPPGLGRRHAQQRIVGRELGRIADLGVARHRADGHAFAAMLDAQQFVAVLQVDVASRRQMARFQDDHEIGAAGKRPRAGMRREIVQRLAERRRRYELIAIEQRNHGRGIDGSLRQASSTDSKIRM
jgi:hypothetical protein